MFQFAATRKPRRPALTPLIDVVFLLLVFSMLAAQFGRSGAIDLSTGGSSAERYEGPPRLLTLLPEGIELNGIPMRAETLLQALEPLISDKDDAIIIRARNGADVQRLTDLTQQLSAAGYTRLVLVE